MAVLGLYACETCPESCAAQQAPDFLINECVDAIDLFESEISIIYLAAIDPADCTEPVVKPTDISLAADWAAVIDNTADDKIRKINVIGDMPKPERQIFTLSGGRRKGGRKTFTINATIDEFNATNYTAMRLLECGFSGFMWFQTKGGLLYGGEKGIKIDIPEADNIKERGENLFEKIDLVIQWEANCSPPMIVSPLIAGCVEEAA